MRVTALEVTETTAIVELRPNWLARLLGARTVLVRLTRSSVGTWSLEASGRPIVQHNLYGHERNGVRHGRALLRALDFRPIAEPPRAEVRACGDRRAP